MSTFPQLEEALEAAAHRHYGRRRRRFAWRPIVPAVAVAAAAAAALLLAPGGAAPPPQERPAATVPEQTLARSHALTLAPLPPQTRTPVAHADLPALAADLERSLPYPPGVEDRFDWAATPPGPYDMSSINYREEVEALLEFRAACLWLRYWLTDASGRAAAATVLAEVPDWPYQRRAGSRWGEIAAAAARADAVALAEYATGQCAGL
jgi:hypothetical protein